VGERIAVVVDDDGDVVGFSLVDVLLDGRFSYILVKFGLFVLGTFLLPVLVLLIEVLLFRQLLTGLDLPLLLVTLVVP
jgi:hypothetical protein